MHISVCICTYKRHALLERLLRDVVKQETEGEFGYSIVVADNDRDESASWVTHRVALTSPVAIRYCVEPRQNIAMARNMALANASGDFIAFLDDDELPPRDWLLSLYR